MTYDEMLQEYRSTKIGETQELNTEELSELKRSIKVSLQRYEEDNRREDFREYSKEAA
jgi:uncharacterized protein (DUF488 family)